MLRFAIASTATSMICVFELQQNSEHSVVVFAAHVEHSFLSTCQEENRMDYLVVITGFNEK